MGAWIEILTVADEVAKALESHPSWVRGLKFAWNTPYLAILESHPSWVRGLKFKSCKQFKPCIVVAPFMGAWIEIC